LADVLTRPEAGTPNGPPTGERRAARSGICWLYGPLSANLAKRLASDPQVARPSPTAAHRHSFAILIQMEHFRLAFRTEPSDEWLTCGKLPR